MNILLVSPSNCIGGAELSLQQVAACLARAGVGVYVAMPPSADNRYETLLRPHVKKILFVKLPTWKKSESAGLIGKALGFASRWNRNRTWHLGPVWQLCRLIKENHIAIAHTNTMMVIDPAIAAKIAGIPHVQHLREVIGSANGSLARFPFQRFPRVFRLFMEQLHSAVVANSRFTLETCRSFFPSDKLRVIYNGVDESFLGVNRLRRNSGELAIARVGLVANVTSKVKNHLLFIQAARAIKERGIRLEFCIYGNLPPVEDPYFQMLERSISQWGLQNSVHFKGLVGNPLDIYAGIDLLVHTYRFESFGRIFIEAMSQGVPVIAVKGGAADELIKDGHTGFLVAGDDPAAIAGRIEALVDSPSLYRHIATSGREHAKQFSSEVTGAKILELYRSLL